MPSTSSTLRLKIALLLPSWNPLQDQTLRSFIGSPFRRGFRVANSWFSCPHPVFALSKWPAISPSGLHVARSDHCSPLIILQNLLQSNIVNKASKQASNQGNTLSIAGTLSRTFAVPSVSGPSCQICEYHVSCAFSDSKCISTSKPIVFMLMSCSGAFTIGARLVPRQLALGVKAVQGSNARTFYSVKCGEYCRIVRGSMKNREPAGSNIACGPFLFDLSGLGSRSSSLLTPKANDFHGSSSMPYSAGAAPDMSFDGSSRDEQVENSQVASDQKALGDQTLKLLSGSCYLPHPDKGETGGEDAHFICVDEQAIGVADGVGGWAELGVDAGQYARELMSHSVKAIEEEPKGYVDPARVLEKAYTSTKARGSSTACIVALTDKGLHAVNLGDSGFIVVRDGCTIFRSPVQQHNFNFTYQLESGNGSDLPSSAQIFSIPVAPGDVMIAGTDGLFDNLYNSEVTAVVVHAVRAGLSPQVTAQKIAALARQRAQDQHRQTPFSTAAQDAGFRYYGGKLDDITVVVSYITRSIS
ncbi:probable protein phosphatase 2C 55 isoform X1 [Amborella trichopoda]|uniref:Protein phosphatase n=1 Tax=Amborella trichopoda TaxID=13333 RepID=U5CW67_AMBTC|nr:probable protein phosphatase 2C 55 isoform X1 [Amborella trichopoda]ERN17541.1 hypothetical protein AMTR_s00059p00109810 [Amborella trichopoda]|eukprot:XP_006856074.1 probable protein phosphatase 2C 55 isoform X1 [Amborella trichopoda]